MVVKLLLILIVFVSFISAQETKLVDAKQDKKSDSDKVQERGKVEETKTTNKNNVTEVCIIIFCFYGYLE